MRYDRQFTAAFDVIARIENADFVADGCIVLDEIDKRLVHVRHDAFQGPQNRLGLVTGIIDANGNWFFKIRLTY